MLTNRRLPGRRHVAPGRDARDGKRRTGAPARRGAVLRGAAAGSGPALPSTVHRRPGGGEGRGAHLAPLREGARQLLLHALAPRASAQHAHARVGAGPSVRVHYTNGMYLLRFVPAPGICSPLRVDWSPCQEYALLSASTGPRAMNMLSSPRRLVPAPGICSP
eukprot:6697900-Pyramimonas_sp.AAC.2